MTISDNMANEIISRDDQIKLVKVQENLDHRQIFLDHFIGTTENPGWYFNEKITRFISPNLNTRESYDGYSLEQRMSMESMMFVGHTTQSSNSQNYGVVAYYIYFQEKIVGHISLSTFNQKNSYHIDMVIGDENYWGKGIASTVAMLVIEESEKAGFKTVHRGADIKNMGSRKVITRLKGMKLDLLSTLNSWMGFNFRLNYKGNIPKLVEEIAKKPPDYMAK
jgi:predicted acetyltransferase